MQNAKRVAATFLVASLAVFLLYGLKPHAAEQPPSEQPPYHRSFWIVTLEQLPGPRAKPAQSISQDGFGHLQHRMSVGRSALEREAGVTVDEQHVTLARGQHAPAVAQLSATMLSEVDAYRRMTACLGAAQRCHF